MLVHSVEFDVPPALKSCLKRALINCAKTRFGRRAKKKRHKSKAVFKEMRGASKYAALAMITSDNCSRTLCATYKHLIVTAE